MHVSRQVYLQIALDVTRLLDLDLYPSQNKSSIGSLASSPKKLPSSIIVIGNCMSFYDGSNWFMFERQNIIDSQPDLVYSLHLHILNFKLTALYFSCQSLRLGSSHWISQMMFKLLLLLCLVHQRRSLQHWNVNCFWAKDTRSRQSLQLSLGLSQLACFYRLLFLSLSQPAYMLSTLRSVSFSSVKMRLVVLMLKLDFTSSWADVGWYGDPTKQLSNL